jgi:CheY-like chemotaxis protein
MPAGGFMKASGASDQPRGRILVVDDDPAYSEYLRRVLSSGGFDVGCQPDAESALTRLQEEPWDLLIADVQLPRMSGLELLGRVREMVPGLPVAILTGYASVDYEISAVSGAAAEFMEKPVSAPELITRAAELVEAARATREEAGAGTRAGPSGPSGRGADRAALPRPRPPTDQAAGPPAGQVAGPPAGQVAGTPAEDTVGTPAEDSVGIPAEDTAGTPAEDTAGTPAEDTRVRSAPPR